MARLEDCGCLPLLPRSSPRRARGVCCSFHRRLPRRQLSSAPGLGHGNGYRRRQRQNQHRHWKDGLVPTVVNSAQMDDSLEIQSLKSISRKALKSSNSTKTLLFMELFLPDIVCSRRRRCQMTFEGASVSTVGAFAYGRNMHE